MKKPPPTTNRAGQSAPEPSHGGSLTPAEKKPLILAALEAYRIQNPDLCFDDWRSQQVRAAVDRAGLSACDSSHFCDLMGHFKTLAGKEDEALRWYVRGQKNAHRRLAWSILNRLENHVRLATATDREIIASTSARRLAHVMARRAAIHDHSEGPLSPDYLRTLIGVAIQKPHHEIHDIKAFLVDHCDVPTLLRIRNTLVNRISEREGVGLTITRNKSQHSPEALAHHAEPETRDFFRR
jgi:hypothetical protein